MSPVNKKGDVKISRKDFVAYEKCRQSGATNMFDAGTVEALTGLNRDTILTIMTNFTELMIKYPGVYGCDNE